MVGGGGMFGLEMERRGSQKRKQKAEGQKGEAEAEASKTKSRKFSPKACPPLISTTITTHP